MQAGMQKAQEELAQQNFESSVGGGKVIVVANGGGEVQSIKIDPSIIDPQDADFLEELVLKGVQEAIALGKGASETEMKKMTGGLNIPGL